MNNKERINNFRSLISTTLLPLINGNYALLDIPNHGNIGDNLIWEGEINFLRQTKYNCVYAANVLNWEEEKIQNAEVILFHGGGNWGDLYRICQDHRLYVISKYKNKRIIVFPQTAWYNDESLLSADCQTINEHPNIVVCLRDKKSYEMLSEYIDKSKLRLIPDMAFFVDIPRITNNSTRSLFLNRTDRENKDNLDIPKGFEVSDWPTYPNSKFIYRLWYFTFYVKNRLSPRLQKNKLTSWLVDSEYGLNRRNGRARYVKKGISFFSKYKTIYTTRLHGLILGVLMGKDMYIVDNKYNKCKNFYDTWLFDFDNIHIV